jgi:redox-sensitive bicupin YhaK (pirin superfamily)
MEDRLDRRVDQVIAARRAVEGEGFVVRRPFPGPVREQVDPFLLLDHMGPVEHAPGEALGTPEHPHRGFETVTYVLDGELEHRDSLGDGGLIGPGDVQWMTAGAGIVHREQPSARLRTEGGRLHGVQLWVNLRASDKRLPPRYQEVPSSTIPATHADGVTVRVIAGAYGDVIGPVETHSAVAYLHASIPASGTLRVPVAAGHSALAYVLSGHGCFGAVDDAVDAGEAELVLFARDEGDVVVRAASDLEVLVLSGEPLHEPLFRYGPFVMNTRDEIVEAFDDYQAGRMGAIPVRR